MRLPAMLGPGSFLWLVAHDLRLNWRGFVGLLGSGRPRLVACLLAAGAVVLHLVAWPAVRWLGPAIHGEPDSAAPLVGLLGATFTWMVAQSIFATTRTLYDRGDLDLLLGSPLPAPRIVAAKAAAIAASTFGSVALLVLPVAHVGAAIDGWAWLGLYPTLIGLALIGNAIGLGLTVGLFLVVGPRRARVYAHMTGAGIGGAFVLSAQILAMLPAPVRASLAVWLDTSESGLGGTGGLVWLPLQAVRGDGLAMAALLAIGVVLLFSSASLLGGRFAEACLATAGTPSAGEAGRRAGARPSFQPGLARNLRHKEWRLLVRDPSLFAQLGLQIIYTIPLAVVLMRSELLPTALALGPTVVMIAAQVAGSIAWLTVSGEDAPELIASAPVAAHVVDRAKLGAVALPVAAVLALPLAGLACVSLPDALVSAVLAAAAGTSTALLNFWHPMPGNRRGMLRRHSQSKLIGLVEHGLAMLWAFATVFALLGSALAIVPVGLVAGVLAFSRWRQSGEAGPRATAAPEPLPT